MMKGQKVQKELENLVASVIEKNVTKKQKDMMKQKEQTKIIITISQ